MPDEPLEWTAFEYEYINKSTDWFWAVGIITVAFAVGAIFLGSMTFAIFIIVAAGALVLLSIKQPDEVAFRIDKRGVHADHTLYPYKNLRSFWVEESMKKPHLILESEKMLVPYVFVPIENVDPEVVRQTLMEYLPEEYHEEPISHEIMRQLGFHH